MENYFRVRFTAKLLKFSLAFKAESQIDIFWKKGQKIAQSSRVPLINTNAIFSEQLSVNCNMTFETQTKLFRQKITKFQVVLYTEKGNKKVGEVKFDVSRYLNERLKTPKDYELALQKCPDPNAKLCIRLSATVQERISADAISQSSERTVNIETLVDGKSSINIENNKPSQIRKQSQPPSRSVIIPTKDVTSQRRQSKTQKKPISSAIQLRQQPQREGSTQKNRDLQAQNKRMRERLSDRERLLRQNQQLRRKIKNEQYQTVRQTKDKIEASKKQLQKLQANIKKEFLLAKQVKAIQDEIFKCKYQIMTAFNYANERGGGKLMFQMQEACGLKER